MTKISTNYLKEDAFTLELLSASCRRNCRDNHDFSTVERPSLLSPNVLGGLGTYGCDCRDSHDFPTLEARKSTGVSCDNSFKV